ncbi:MAG: hypothetical protein G01um101433_593 [Parcubacteria group bacterium Gr01-1014_33]|nr:MAG: hypothetical protein G01um101433_593 [Parcubacteria group bacterium Gr01-1014_33]
MVASRNNRKRVNTQVTMPVSLKGFSNPLIQLVFAVRSIFSIKVSQEMMIRHQKKKILKGLLR